MDELVNQKFGRLTILDIFFKEKNGRRRKYAKCICECSNIVEVRIDSLKCKDIISCGCFKKRKNLTGKKINRLLVLEEIQSNCLCLCDCGKTILINRLKFGKIKSCGCLIIEKNREKLNNYRKTIIIQDPKISSAKNVWSIRYKDIKFEDFYEISQKNCSYCGSIPNNNYTRFNNIGLFNYNGLDRIDPLKGYTLDNVASCCNCCNRFKLDRSIDDFKQNIIKLINHNRIDISKYRELSLSVNILNNKFLMNTVKCVISFNEINYHLISKTINNISYKYEIK
jgi:hypothetical protein